MSVAAPSPPAVTPDRPAGPLAPGASEACPLCGAALHPEQDWCLRCGAAARTRLAASPNWKPPAVALGAVIVLALGVLAASLVKLAGDSGSRPAAITKTVTAPAAAASTLGSPPAGAPASGPNASTATASTPTGTSTGATPPAAGARAAGRAAGSATAPARAGGSGALAVPGSASGRGAVPSTGALKGKAHRVLGHELEKQLQKLRKERTSLK